MRICMVVLFACAVCTTAAQAMVDVPENRLHRELFSGYNRQTHPKKTGTGPVVVHFDFQLIRILDVSARDQYITTYAWVNQFWRNDLLKWKPEDYGGVEEIHVSPDDVWVPDTLLYNNIDEEQRIGGGRTAFTTNVALRYNGENTWLNPALYKSICSVDVTNFPFDDQECSLKFGSWAFDISKIDLRTKNDTVLNNYYIKNGEWELLNLSAKRHALKYQCCPHAFVDITVEVGIRRESLDYILKLIIPCSLISSMIFLGFVLPPESGERIGLSITVLLAMTVFQQLSSELMPSYGFPLLGQFYFAIMLEIGASLAVTTLILNFYHRNRRRMPKTMRKVILRWLARILFPCQKPKDWSSVQRQGAIRQRHLENVDVEYDDLENGKCRRSSDDPVLYNEDRFGYENDEISHRPRECTCGLREVRTLSANRNACNGSNGSQSRYPQGGSPTNGAVPSGLGNETSFKKLKRKSIFIRDKLSFHILKRRSSIPALLQNPMTVDIFGNNVQEVNEEKLKNQKEWIKAARVLDRLFLIISIVVSVSTLLTIFLRAPRFSLQL